MRGTGIVVSVEPKGIFVEGTIIGTPKPGTMMEIDMTQSPLTNSGRFSWRVYQPGTNGQRRVVAILREDDLQGKLITDAYVTGTRGFLYIPQAGEELNVLLKDIAGTADDHIAGETLIAESGSGKFIATTGSPQSEPFRILESIIDPVVDTLVWAMYTGY